MILTVSHSILNRKILFKCGLVCIDRVVISAMHLNCFLVRATSGLKLFDYLHVSVIIISKDLLNARHYSCYLSFIVSKWPWKVCKIISGLDTFQKVFLSLKRLSSGFPSPPPVEHLHCQHLKLLSWWNWKRWFFSSTRTYIEYSLPLTF